MGNGCVNCMRIFLLICCVLSVFGSIIILFRGSSANVQVIGGFVDSAAMDIITTLLNLGFSSLGAYALYKDDVKLIRYFAYCMAAFTLISALKLMYIVCGTSLDERIKENFYKAMQEYNWSGSPSNGWIDKVQSSSMCCGYEGPRDWIKYRQSSVNSTTYPPSCCYDSSSSKICDDSRVYGGGCRSTLEFASTFGIVGVVIGFTSQAFFCLMTFIVARSMNEQSASSRQVGLSL